MMKTSPVLIWIIACEVSCIIYLNNCSWFFLPDNGDSSHTDSWWGGAGNGWGKK